jgi:hypothetical protein
MGSAAARGAGSVAGHVGGMFGKSWGAGWGGAAQGSMWEGAGIASRMGGGLGSGIARGLGMGAAGTEAMAGVGALASGVMLPFAAGYVALQTANHLVFDQYTNARANANNLHSNFSNIYFGNGGDSVTGKGLSYRQSASLGNRINSLGNNDRMFSQSDYSQIFDMSSRAGLYDNVKTSGIVSRTKDIAEQIKLIVAISKDPNIQQAIEQLSSLNLAGASLTGGRTSSAAGAMQTLGSYASQAGVSVQRLMSGVGAQGQYLFQANGMTPYLGQLAAANSYAGFSAAQRSGLLSSAALARSGGIEGATQGSLTAQIMGSQTPYAMMSAYNKYIGGSTGNSIGGPNQDITSTVAAFGAHVANDPITALGGMALYGKAAAGADLARQGSAGLENQAISHLKSMHVAPRGANGRYTPEQVAAVMQGRMGLTPDNIRDYMANRASEADPGAYAIRMQAMRGNAMEQTRSFMNQTGSGGGLLDSALRGMSRTGGALMDNTNNALVDPVVRGVGYLGDGLNKAADWWGYSSINDHKVISDPDSVFSGGSQTSSVSIIDTNAIQRSTGYLKELSKGKMRSVFNNTNMDSSDGLDILDHINTLARSGNQDAKKFINATSISEKKKHLENLARSDFSSLGKHGSMLSSEGGIAGIKSSEIDENVGLVSGLAGGAAFLKTESSTNTDRENYLDAASRLVNDSPTIFRSSSSNHTTTMGLAELHEAGAAEDLARLRDEKNMTNSELFELAKKDSRYASLLKGAGGDSASESTFVKRIELLQGNAAKGGLMATAYAAFQDFTDEALSKTNSSSQAAWLSKQTKARGGNLFDVGSSSERSINSLDAKGMAAYQKAHLTRASEMKNLTDQYVNNQIDWSTYQANTGKIDSATEFRLGVDKFLEGVQLFRGIPKEKKEDQARGRSAPSNSSNKVSTDKPS